MSWIHRAACRDVDPEIFFPIADPDTKAGQVAEAKAKTVCAGCLVKPECLGVAIAHREPFGVWGGHGERDRRTMLSAAARGTS